MSSKLFLRTFTLIMLSGQSGLFPLLPWSRLPLSCGCHQCSWWSWSCHAWCCVANVAATWQLQLQNDHVFTGFYPFWAIYGCYRHWLLNGNGHILIILSARVRNILFQQMFASFAMLRNPCAVSRPNTPSTFSAGWSWGFKSQSEQVSSVCVFVFFVACKDFLLHFVPLTLLLSWLSWSKKFDTLWSYHDFKILQARFWMLLAMRPF